MLLLAWQKIKVFQRFQECWSGQYLQNGLKKCKCIPFSFKNYSNKVRNKKCLIFKCVFQNFKSTQGKHAQESPLCTPEGLECYENETYYTQSCLIPCKGIYADVTKEPKSQEKETNEEMQILVHEYEKYKRGGEEDITYDRAIESM